MSNCNAWGKKNSPGSCGPGVSVLYIYLFVRFLPAEDAATTLESKTTLVEDSKIQ